MPPRHELLDTRLRQLVLCRNLRPLRCRTLHPAFQRRDRLGWTLSLEAKVRGQLRPHPAPAKYVAVHDIEGLVQSGACRRSPRQMPREQLRIGRVRQRIPLQMGAGKHKRTTRLPAQRGIHGQAYAHVHGISQSETDDGVRAMHAPAEAEALRGGKQNILLRVVEVQPRQTRSLLAKRRLCRSLAIAFERPQVLLGPRNQRRMNQRMPVQLGKQVFDHATVHLYVFFFGVVAKPAAEEHMRDFAARQRGSQRAPIQKIGRQRNHATLG